MEQDKWGVIDIGSNTIRLVIYEKKRGGSYKETENIKTVARLRQYLDDDKVLIDEGIKKLIHILQGFKEVILYHHVSVVYCVATATIRQSKNHQDILSIVKEKTGFDIDIYSEKDEAFTGYYAVTRSTPIESGVTIDMGGGSTEVTYFENRKLIYYHSFPFGSVSLKEQFMKQEKMTDQEKKELNAYLLNAFNELPWLRHINKPIIAIGGSARNIAQIDQNLKKYPIAGIHQYTMSSSDLMLVQTYLGQFSVPQLEKVEGLSNDRADIIIPALEAFVKFFEYTKAPFFMFSRRGLRDGISMKNNQLYSDFPTTDEIISYSIKELLVDYDVHLEHAEHRAYLAQNLFEQLTPYYSFYHKDFYQKMVIIGAKLYYLGIYIDDDSSSQHTFYLLANQSINGLFHQDRVRLAFIASFKNNTLLKQYYTSFTDWFSKEEMATIRVVGAIAKLASSLDSSKRSIIKNISVTRASKDALQLNVNYSGNAFVERYELEKHLRQLEKALRISIVVQFLQVSY
ncbi:exopolyphosphatase [Niallia sp. Krafla_26]|uniref:Ppx/GppA phosphatase family protein n=1 Tax=Niallia sp. Krafla_26 TaxID=3064703 RepID=UPI003D180EE1